MSASKEKKPSEIVSEFLDAMRKFNVALAYSQERQKKLEAEIVEIVGTFCGEPVGISKHDGTTWYYKGDVVEVEDFDLSDEECSTGYHFFCTREEAEAY